MKNIRAQKGTLVELKIFTELINREYPVYIPMVQSTQIDCLIDTEEGLKKIQIKTARRKHKPYRNYYAQIRSFNTKINYADYGIDFIICEGNNRFFVIDKKDFEGKTNFDLPINKYEGNWNVLPLPPVFKEKTPKKEKQVVLNFPK